MTYLTNIPIFSWLLNQIIWGFGEMQIISNSFITLNNVQINVQFWKLLDTDAETPIVIFGDKR